jgi:hypothetical protein
MFVLEELRRMNKLHEGTDAKLDAMTEKMSGKFTVVNDRLTDMKVKVAGIATVAGIVVAIITNLIIKGIK